MAELDWHLQQEQMAKVYWPERLEILPELPKTASGKVQRFLLPQQIAEQVAKETGDERRYA
jgi:acyl-coenzyme A synthetase/AMP-(fatty) acid ligase